MLEDVAVDKDTFDIRAKSKGAILRSIAGKSAYDEFASPLDEEDRERTQPAAVSDGDPYRDLGPPQEETIPLEDAHPFPMLAPPVEF